jgi:hypothetical protein
MLLVVKAVEYYTVTIYHACASFWLLRVFSLHVSLCNMAQQVGEGLCPRGDDSSQAMQLYTSVLGNSGDLYVGGTFESRVWNGHNFVNVYHAARYDGKDGCLLCPPTDTAIVEYRLVEFI